MKKDLLFIINNLNCGGAEKALVSLLQVLDYSKYNVDLLLLTKEGLFLDKVPSEVTFLQSPDEMPYFDMPFKSAMLKSLSQFRFDIFIARLALVYVSKTEKNESVREQKMWKYLSFCLKKVDKKYDVAIGYLQKTPTYYCVDKVSAKSKIGFMHNDYDQLGMDAKIDHRYFEKLKSIVTVSEKSKEILIKNFPVFKNKFAIMKNIISSKAIHKLALEEVSLDKSEVVLMSVGRLNTQKGYDFAVKACKILSDRGLKFKWFILGDGGERKSLEAEIKKYRLEDKFILLGIKENPYSFIKSADVFVHTARFEGYGIVITEAKILNRPMLLTNFDLATAHINNEFNGLICEMNPESIANSLERLIIDKYLREKFSLNLAKETLGNESEIEVFYSMIES